jgi:hypothetical protein
LALSDEVATLTSLSLNQIIEWLREISLLRQGASICAPQAFGSEDSAVVEYPESAPEAAPNRVCGAAKPSLETAKP